MGSIFRERGERLTLLALAAALLLLVAATGISGPAWMLARNIRALLWGAVLIAAAFLQGSVMFHLLVPSRDRYDDGFSAMLSVGLGFGALSLEALVLGLAGVFTQPVLTILVLAVLAAAAAAVRYGNVPLRKFPLPERHEVWLPLGLTGLAVYLNLTFALVPPVYFDAMSYHLELPSRYLLEGRVFHVAENLYSGYPQLVEVLYGLGLALSGIGVAGMVSFIGFLLVLGLIWSWGRERFDEETAAWAIVLVAFTPPLMTLAGFFHNDWFMTFFTLAAVLVLTGGEHRSRWMVLAGVFAGLAAGTKYTGLGYAVVIPLLAGMVFGLGGRGPGTVRRWSVFAAAALFTACPWYLKNLVFTGDPLFPLISGMRGEIQGLSALASDAYFKGITIDSLWQWMILPYQAVFRYWELQLALSPGIIPLVLLFTLPSLRRARAVDPFLLRWVMISLVVWYLTFRAGRFALPMAVLILVWLAAAFRSAVRVSPRNGPFLTSTVALLLFMNLGSVLGFQSSDAEVLKGAFTRTSGGSYLYDTYAPYRAINVLNSMDPKPKVLFLGEMKGFYSEFPREVATFEVPNRLLVTVREGTTADESADALLAKGFTHILYNPGEMERLAAKTPQLRLDQSEKDRLETFFREKTNMIFEANGISVWKIRRE